MELELLKVFDRIVPDRLKWDIKEFLRSFEYYKYNIFKNGYEVFSRVDIETNTHCNRSCKICPINFAPKPCKYMQMETYQTLLNQLKEIKFKGRIAPVFYNEPMLDERLPDLMRIAKSVLPEAELTIYTNGSLLTTDSLNKLIDSGLDGIIISQYADNLPRDDVTYLFEELPYSVKKKLRYRVLNDDQPLSTRGGLVEVKKPITKKFCYQASTDVVIDCDGNVLLCCNDFYTEHIFGNIREDHILQIWNKPEFKKLRRDLRKGEFREKICKACAGKS